MSKKDEQMFKRYWRKLFGKAQVALQGASDIALQVQLFDVLEDFFDNSNCWQEAIPVSVIPNTLIYQIYPLQEGRILRLNGVLDQNNMQQQAIMPVAGTLQFLYPYNSIQTMTAIVVKTVTDPLCCFPPGIPEWLLPAFGRGIYHGLVGAMFLQPGQSYSNPQMANYHTQKFRDAWAHARVSIMKANTVGAQNWAFPQQFRTYSQKGGVSTFNVHPTPQQ